MHIEVKSKNLILMLAVAIFLAGTVVFAANPLQFSQNIGAGSKSVDIVDAGGATVFSPTVSFGALSFSFDPQDGTGILGTDDQTIRVSNPTASQTWTVSVAGSAPNAVWTDAGSNTYDFNDGSGYADGADAGDTVGGQMTIDPSDVGVSLNGVNGCSTSNIILGGEDSFVEGSVDSIDLVSAAAGASMSCRWDLTNVPLTQKIPASQAPAIYSVSLVLTIS